MFILAAPITNNNPAEKDNCYIVKAVFNTAKEAAECPMFGVIAPLCDGIRIADRVNYLGQPYGTEMETTGMAAAL